MKLSDRYPWHRMQSGESFFVPCLDPGAVMLEGRQQAAAYFGNNCVKAVPCIYKGLLGVMFRLRNAPRSRGTPSDS